MDIIEYLEILKLQKFLISLQFANIEDASFIIDLRTDSKKSQHISKTSSSVKKQEQWLIAYKKREKINQEHYFIIVSNYQKIGTIRLYNYLNDGGFCWGSWVLNSLAPPKSAYSSAMLVYEIGFGIMNKKYAYFDVRKDNESVWKFHERTGAKLIKEDSVNRYYHFTKDSYIKLRNQWRKFLPEYLTQL